MSIEPVDSSQIKPLHPVNLLRQYLEKKKNQPLHSTAGRIDLIEISPLLPWLILIEDKGLGTDIDFWVKFAGPAIAGLIGIDPTGLRINDGLPKKLAGEIRRECLHAQLSKKPRYSIDEFKIAGMSKKQVYQSVHPLSKSAGMTIDQLIWTMAPGDIEIEFTRDDAP
ncbi:MAG: hypothetical protein RLN89_10700 [Parvibaculum sp.]